MSSITGAKELPLNDVHEFDSGARRSEVVAGYHRLFPAFCERVARRGDFGESKYGKHNYRRGLNDPQFVEQLFDHAIEHLLKAAWAYYTTGSLHKTYEDDLAAAGWGLMVLMEAQEAEANRAQAPISK